MRIVGGEWRSRRIDAPREGLRPTADRVREAVFNILANIVDFEECTVCDLFAGSGAMGIEALSRGATYATFVEEHRVTASVISKNLRTLGAGDRATVMVGDALEYACKSGEPADLVFADPPYDYPQVQDVVACALRRPLFRRALIVEHAASVTIESAQEPWKRRTFGKTGVTIFLREDT